MDQRERRLARLFRAESLRTQSEFADETGIDRSTVAHYESGKDTPTPRHLERMAACARLTIAAGEEVLELVDTLRRPRVRQGLGIDDLGTIPGPGREFFRTLVSFSIQGAVVSGTRGAESAPASEGSGVLPESLPRPPERRKRRPRLRTALRISARAPRGKPGSSCEKPLAPSVRIPLGERIC